jgi:hypothetical protein
MGAVSTLSKIEWRNQLRTEGYAHFPGLVPFSLTTAAREAIDYDLRTNYDPARRLEYDNRSYCPGILGTTSVMGLLCNSPCLELIDDALGLANIAWDKGQIAIRRSHNVSEAVPPEPHIDGFASGLNGLEHGRVYNHTALVGIFLSPVERLFAGNFTVWPGSHYAYEDYFQKRGPQAMNEPMPTPQLGKPVQLLCEVGDVVFCHYQLGHTAAVNTADIDRIAVYFRVVLRNMDERRWKCLTNIWEGWRV